MLEKKFDTQAGRILPSPPSAKRSLARADSKMSQSSATNTTLDPRSSITMHGLPEANEEQAADFERESDNFFANQEGLDLADVVTSFDADRLTMQLSCNTGLFPALLDVFKQFESVDGMWESFLDSCLNGHYYVLNLESPKQGAQRALGNVFNDPNPMDPNKSDSARKPSALSPPAVAFGPPKREREATATYEENEEDKKQKSDGQPQAKKENEVEPMDIDYSADLLTFVDPRSLAPAWTPPSTTLPPALCPRPAMKAKYAGPYASMVALHDKALASNLPHGVMFRLDHEAKYLPPHVSMRAILETNPVAIFFMTPREERSGEGISLPTFFWNINWVRPHYESEEKARGAYNKIMKDGRDLKASWRNVPEDKRPKVVVQDPTNGTLIPHPENGTTPWRATLPIPYFEDSNYTTWEKVYRALPFSGSRK